MVALALHRNCRLNDELNGIFNVMITAFTQSDVAAHTLQICTLIDGEDAGTESLWRKWSALLPPPL